MPALAFRGFIRNRPLRRTTIPEEPNMTAVAVRRFAWLLPVLLVIPLAAADPDEKEVERLVKQLGHDDFDKREEATMRLKEIGEPALVALVKAKSSDDAEVRRRAEEILLVIDKKLS